MASNVYPATCRVDVSDLHTIYQYLTDCGEDLAAVVVLAIAKGFRDADEVLDEIDKMRKGAC